jgi:para-aminobenzoate synthetase component 1
MDSALAAALAIAGEVPDDEPVAIVRGARGWTVAWDAAEVAAADGAEALAALDSLRAGWWAGFLTYELGSSVEKVSPRRPGPPPTPDLGLVRFRRRRSFSRGATPGRAAARERVLLGGARSSLDRTTFRNAACEILEHIAAGDCYQVNLTRRLTWPDTCDPLGLFATVAAAVPARHATFARVPTPRGPVVVASASPERFLAWNGSSVETRPIKGTAARASGLRRSTKDRAENVMIVDLARNDLGRVCEPGTIHVPELCTLEQLPGLVHLVSCVRGRLRTGTGLGELVRATFPPASITGAPKPRVLQIIEDLEPVARGVYCGAIGWLDTERHRGDLAVAIRTFTIAGGETSFGVGAGIVADSDPDREWAETALKAERFVAAVAGWDVEQTTTETTVAPEMTPVPA